MIRLLLVLLAAALESRGQLVDGVCPNKWQAVLKFQEKSIDATPYSSVTNQGIVVNCQNSCCEDPNCMAYSFREVIETGDKTTVCNLYNEDIENTATVVGDLPSLTLDYRMRRPQDYRATSASCPAGETCMLNMVAYMFPTVFHAGGCPKTAVEGSEEERIDFAQAFITFDEYVVKLGVCTEIFGNPSMVTCVNPNYIRWIQYQSEGCEGNVVADNLIENGNTCVDAALRPAKFTAAWDGACSAAPYLDREAPPQEGGDDCPACPTCPAPAPAPACPTCPTCPTCTAGGGASSYDMIRGVLNKIRDLSAAIDLATPAECKEHCTTQQVVAFKWEPSETGGSCQCARGGKINISKPTASTTSIVGYV